MKKYGSPFIGLTSTIPVETVIAAGFIPLDINNLFIQSPNPEQFVGQAEEQGFSHNVCAWIKGIYSAAINHGLERVITVTGGDCSNSIALAEILELHGISVIPFDYPISRDRNLLGAKLEEFRLSLSASSGSIEIIKSRLDKIRAKLSEVDRLTWEENLVTGFENHLFLVSSSDFKSDPDGFEREIDSFLENVRKRRPIKDRVRLGYLGVPPIYDDLYQYLEKSGARVVFNEVQRQFSMPWHSESMVEQYHSYTYPYGAEARIDDIMTAVKERKLDGLIHYIQNFCYRQLYDIILRQKLDVPLLTLEGDRPGSVDRRTALRLDTFVEMIERR